MAKYIDETGLSTLKGLVQRDIAAATEVASELDVRRLFRTEYAITANITNGSASGDATIWTQETATVTLSADEGYKLPTSITVTGASNTYNQLTGVVALSNTTENVVVEGVCTLLPIMPIKGDIITLDNDTTRYRVLKINGTVAEVFAMDDVGTSLFNDSLVTTTFSDGSTGPQYENSMLDTYMNVTFFNSLSANIKTSIIQKTITQTIYQMQSSEISGFDFAITRVNSGTRWYKRKGQISVGSRYCYALDIDDVAEYLGAESGSTVSGANFNDMFFEQTTATSKYIWLTSANTDSSDFVSYARGSYGCFYRDRYNFNACSVRPAFQIDLSKVDFTKE